MYRLSVEPALISWAVGRTDANCDAIQEQLALIDLQLSNNTFIDNNESMSLADVFIACSMLHYLSKHENGSYDIVFDKIIANCPNVKRWLKMINFHLQSADIILSKIKKQETSVSKSGADVKEIAWPASRVRNTFIEFFEKKGHTFVRSSPVVPHDDPTLLFANAGMNQFKPIFLGTVSPTSPLAKLSRACNTQKCIRAGGKHNDLDDVGKDTYHHTFFEMLGNWSFGDYFKEEAIGFAWELLTEVYKLPANQLYATYFGGDEKQGLKPDDDAKQIWLRYLPSDRVLPFDCKDNFWEMGDVGPCGPCTEIHFDRLGDRFVPELVNADDPTVIEIWNVVFIQFNRESDGVLKNLPAVHVDTGMGFERLTSIKQNVLSNYDTDIFTPIFDVIKSVSGAIAYTGKLGKEDVGCVDMSYRVIADHIRTLSFAIADGARPGNEGREYVLRRILRRAVRYGQQNLGAPSGFFAKLVDPFVSLMGDTFPELKTQAGIIKSVIADEETTFGKTLQRGIEMFAKAAQATKGNVISGKDCFLLWDTFGFPPDLTKLMAEERGLDIDTAGFESAMEEAKEIARAARKTGAVADLKMEAEQTSHLQKQGIAPTDDSPKFLERDVDTIVRAILGKTGFVDCTSHLQAGESIGIVLHATSFYAEQGGQIFDTGSLVAQSCTLDVLDTRTAAGFVLHVSQVPYNGGAISVGDQIRSCVDYTRRRLILPNHTFTHIVNLALRDVLGDGINQKGSLNDSEKLRFDFSHNKPMTLQQLENAEKVVRTQLESNYEVYTEEVALKDAMEIHGVRAVFGEVYPDPVRVVSIGVPINDLLKNPKNPKWIDYSVEFCGGTHLKMLGEAKAFTFLFEEAVGKGVRRVVAVTGQIALDAIAKGENLLHRLETAEKMSDDLLSKELNAIKTGLDAMIIPGVAKMTAREKIASLTKRLIEVAKKKTAANKERCVSVVCSAVKEAAESSRQVVALDAKVGLDGAALREAVVQANKACGEVAVILLSADEVQDRIMAYTGVPKGLQDKIDCVKWIRAALDPVQGKGGGKNGVAQGQGVGAAKLGACMQAALYYTN